MPTLNFKGKPFVQNHHLAVKYHQLVPNKKNSLSDNISLHDNLIIQGDNVKALKALLPTYGGKVKCIYIDPPYNTGNEGWVYNDNVNNPMMQEWLGNVVDTEDLTRHDKWLCMMMPRLKLLRELLAEDGAIFISCDDNEQHNLRCLLNEIFGEENFLSSFMWKRKKEISSDSKNIAVQGEYILSFSKSSNTTFHFESLSKSYVEKSYNKPTKDFPKGMWRPVPLTVSKGLSGGGYEYEITNPNGTKHKRIWAYPENSFAKLVDEKLIYYGKDGTAIPQRVMYAEDSKGQPVTNYWDDVSTNKEGKKELIELFENNSFDTPKPSELVKKVIRLVTNKNDIILDSFAGSGTTAHAVLDLNKEDGGNRKCILIEMEDYANTITAERVRRVINGVPESKSFKEGTGGTFSYFELGNAIEMSHILDGTNLPSYVEFARYLFYTATGEQFDESKINEKTGFIGESTNYTVYLIYKPDIEYLKTTALTLEMAKALPEFKDKQRLVFAPMKYLDQHFLRDLRIDFCQLPYEVYKMEK